MSDEQAIVFGGYVDEFLERFHLGRDVDAAPFFIFGKQFLIMDGYDGAGDGPTEVKVPWWFGGFGASFGQLLPEGSNIGNHRSIEKNAGDPLRCLFHEQAYGFPEHGIRQLWGCDQ